MRMILEKLISERPRLSRCAADIAAAGETIIAAFRRGGKVLVCGNGGSAADAEHICGELLKKFK